MTRTRAGATVAVLVLGCAAGTACAGVPEPRAPGSGVVPAVTAGQAARVAARTGQSLSDPATALLTGPARAWSDLAARAGLPPSPAAAGGTAEVVVSPLDPAWPKSFAVVRGAEPSVLEVYVSESARSPYLLWAAMPVLEGEGIPAFPGADDGAAVPTPEAAGGPLPAAPASSAPPAADALAVAGPSAVPPSGGEAEGRPLAAVVADLPLRYADVLAHRAESVHAAEFAPDGFSAALAARTDADAARLATVAVSETRHEPVADAGTPVVLSATATDGSALVVAAVRTTTTATARPGEGVIGVPAEYALLVPGGSASTLRTTSVAALAFVVPPERGNIRVVAAADAVVEVEAS